MKLKPCDCLKTIENQTKKVLREQTFENSWKHCTQYPWLGAGTREDFYDKNNLCHQKFKWITARIFLIGAKIFSSKLESKYILPPTKTSNLLQYHFLGFAKYVQILNQTGLVVLKRS